MISKKYIKLLDFESIEDIFNYIVDSEINGNYTQTKELINKLSYRQYYLFLQYIQQYEINENTFNKMRLIK